MKLSPAIKKETFHIALGVLAGDAVMFAAFILLQKFDYTVVLGAVLGSAAAILNFLYMGYSVQKAMDDPERAKILVQKSYTKRMMAMFGVMILGVVVPWFHIVAVVVPFLLPSLTIHAMRLLGMYNPDEKGGEKE